MWYFLKCPIWSFGHMGTWSHSNFNLLGIAAYSYAFILYPYHWLHLPLDGLGRTIDTSVFRGWRSLSSFTRQVSWKHSQALARWNLLSSYLWRWAGMEEIRLSLYLSFPLLFLCSRTFFFALRVQMSFYKPLMCLFIKLHSWEIFLSIIRATLWYD